MKRLWFAVIFLCIAASLCVFEQVTIHRFYHGMSDRIAAAAAYQEAGDNARLRESVTEIRDYWHKKNDIIFMMTNHHALNELSKEIHALNPEDVDNGLYKVSASLHVFYENQRITPSNIF